mgnify:CR=1 FL=1
MIYTSEEERKLMDINTMTKSELRQELEKFVKQKYSFKVDISKDILVTEEQRMRFLEHHNKLKDTLQSISEIHDISLSDVRNIEELVHHLHQSLKFAPQRNDDNTGASYYADYVLKEDEMAYEYDNNLG